MLLLLYGLEQQANVEKYGTVYGATHVQLSSPCVLACSAYTDLWEPVSCKKMFVCRNPAPSPLHAQSVALRAPCSRPGLPLISRSQIHSLQAAVGFTNRLTYIYSSTWTVFVHVRIKQSSWCNETSLSLDSIKLSTSQLCDTVCVRHCRVGHYRATRAVSTHSSLFGIRVEKHGIFSTRGVSTNNILRRSNMGLTL